MSDLDLTTVLAYEAGSDEAEARIVAWVREVREIQRARHANDPTWLGALEMLTVIADAIERGEHRGRTGDDGGE